MARYGFAVFVSAAAVLVTRLGWPFLKAIPFMPGFLAVFLAGAFGGGWAGMTAVGLIAVGLSALPASTAGIRAFDPPELLRLGLFMGVGAVASALNGRLWSARRDRVFLFDEAERMRVAAEGAGLELRQILDSIQDGFCALDRDLRFTYLNRRAEEILRSTRAELAGQSATEAYGLGPADVALLRRVREDRVPEHLERFVPVFGAWFDVHLYPGSTSGLIILFRDATERHENEERLRRHAAIFESSEDAIIAKNLEGTITAWNPGAERLLGYSEHEIVGKPVSTIMPLEHRDDMNKILTRIRRGERVEHFETVRLSKDGKRVPVSLSVSPVKDAAGNIVGAAKIARDISESRRIQAEQQRLFKEAEEAVRLRDEFLSVAGHELRTPVAALQLQLYSLRRRVSLAQWSRIPESVEKLGRQLDRLSQLTEEVLDVTRLSAGRMTLEREEVDLGELVREVVERQKESAGSDGSKIDADAPPGILGRWDRSRLDQVATNLLSNAVKFGGGRPIRVQVRSAGDGAVLSVQDEGIGISPEDQSKIFARFERAVSRRSYAGMGLGLWIAREIVDAHGGSLAVESRPGFGSTFRVHLPAAPAASTALAAAVVAVAVAGAAGAAGESGAADVAGDASASAATREEST